MGRKLECDNCHEVLEYKSAPIFGDPALGVSDEWLQCPRCRRRYNIGSGKERK